MTLPEVQKILQNIGLRPQQAAGQNFLLDENIVEAIADASGVEEGQTVLEIGPGLGILTASLLARGVKVVAVELDERLFQYLKRIFKGQTNLKLIKDDIFKVNLKELLNDGEYSLVANLPYSATSLVFRNFLTLSPRPNSMTVMVQRDVAKRICARPGDMSMLALTVQRYCQPEMVFDVQPKSFFPVPKVTSTVLHCHSLKPVDEAGDKTLFRIMKAGFSARRKKLHNSLSATLHIDPKIVTETLAKVSQNPNVRAQELTLEQWVKIAKNLS